MSFRRPYNNVTSDDNNVQKAKRGGRKIQWTDLTKPSVAAVSQRKHTVLKDVN